MTRFSLFPKLEMQIALILLTTLYLVRCSCPSGFELVRDGECRGKLGGTTNIYWDECYGTAVAQCDTIQGQVPIIHDSEHQAYYETHYFTVGVPLALVCNSSSKRWEWADGSTLDYKPEKYDKELDTDCTTGCIWYLFNKQSWYHNCGHSSKTSLDYWCTVSAMKPEHRECENFEDDSEDGACYEIGATAENWQDAQIECRNYGADLASIHNQKENSFLRRLAVSKGTVNGLYLGGTISGKGKDGFGWIDGTEWDYSNFMPGFPVDGLGDCLVMDTFGTSGQWMNMDCNTKLAVACIRSPNISVLDACSTGPWKEGQIIYTPGYPYDASVGCDYFLTVASGQKVELTIHMLEANTCCDHLLLSDDYFGGHAVANLTGEVSNKIYTTGSSNLMRVSWNPVGGVGVRGAMFSFRAV